MIGDTDKHVTLNTLNEVEKHMNHSTYHQEI